MRRANGTGSVTKLPGNRRRPYVVEVSQRDRYGFVVQKNLGYYEKAAEAQQALEEYNLARKAGAAPAADKLSLTVGQVFEGWKEREYRKLKPASIASHNAAWNKRVSRFAGRKIRDLGLDDWQSLLDEDEDAGLSQSSINNDALLMKALCAYAMERDIIGKDYTKYLDIPSVGAKKKRDALNDMQLARLKELAQGGFPWADTALMLCYTGFRVSEFLSLTRFSYNVKEDYLQGGLKTDAGKNRIVPVHPVIAPYLRRWLDRGGERIICGEDGGPVSSQVYREKFSRVAEEIGVPEVTPHWCRHTFATLLHKAGADPMTAKWLLGHSTSADITAHYTHQTVGILQEAIRLLA